MILFVKPRSGSGLGLTQLTSVTYEIKLVLQFFPLSLPIF